MRRLALFIMLMAAPCFVGLPCAADTVLVAVAANFKDTQDALGGLFEKKTGHVVASSSGSTGKLFAQAQNGAPFQVFLSADVSHAEKLEQAGLTVKGSRFTYAIGRLALYSATLDALTEGPNLLSPGKLKHLAIANPETAPYGAAAIETMKALAAWDALKDHHIVYAENIAQAFQFAESGAAEAGFVAYAQVLKKRAAKYWLVPAQYHAPLRQDAVLLAPGAQSVAARTYLDFLRGPDARALIEASGYTTEK